MIWFDTLEQNHLNLQLTSISIRELFYLAQSPCSLYLFTEEKVFKEAIRKDDLINRESLSLLIKNGRGQVFISYTDYERLKESQQDNLRKTIRSLSMEKSPKAIRKLINLLSINLNYLYENPNSDELLTLQYQSILNLFNFLQENTNYLKLIYEEIVNQAHHYIINQPLISSLFLFGFLKNNQFYSKKEMETLFIASYFKDLGMASIPSEKFDGPIKTKKDQLLFSNHPNSSVKYLIGRIPLGTNYLNIIKFHHFHHSLVSDNKLEKNNENVIIGFETNIISIMDIISAMISKRPFRSQLTLFESLIVAKKIMIRDFPKEFSYLVNFFKDFFRPQLKF
ncbi:MAG: hypothetical protein VYD54_13555 [Bdellovibrionota bacterium]|nr:hypothetical protein [Bdellovibrionota bacterium]